MYYSEESNHSSHLFHSMIQLARGLGVSNPNPSIMNATADMITMNHSPTDNHYGTVASIPWSTNSMEMETDYQKRRNFGSSFHLLNPLDPKLNEVGRRYLTNHVDYHSDLNLPPNGIATHTGDPTVLPYRSGQYSHVKFPIHTDTYTGLVETCHSLSHLKHLDYDDGNATTSGKIFPSMNPNDFGRDELIKDGGKTIVDNEFNFTFPPMYTFRHRPESGTDSHGGCISTDHINSIDHVIHTGKCNEQLSPSALRLNGNDTNILSQYTSNFTMTNTTITNTNALTNHSINNSVLSSEYGPKNCYNAIKSLHPPTGSPFTNKPENELTVLNENESFNSHYTPSIGSPSPKGHTVKWWPQDCQDENKVNPFRHVWNQNLVDPLANSNSEPETHNLVAFAELFKQKRIKLGATQAEVGRALGDLNYGGFGCLSQSTICRFESLSLSQNNMLALKPILQAWLEQAEKRLVNTHPRFDSYNPLDEPDLRNSYDCVRTSGKNDLDEDANSILDYTFERKRKRTSITGPEKRSLEAYFAIQPRPSSDQLKLISNKLKLPKSVVRVWFCNQRQKQKRLQTVNHTCSGTSSVSLTNDTLCGLCRTPASESPSTYQVSHEQWNLAGK